MCAHVRVCVCLSVCVWRGEWILIIGGHSRGEEVSRPLAHIFQPEQLVEPLRAKALTFHRHARAVEEKWWKKKWWSVCVGGGDRAARRSTNDEVAEIVEDSMVRSSRCR